MTEKFNNHTPEKASGPQPKNFEELEEWADAQLDSDDEIVALRSELKTVRSKSSNSPREAEIVDTIKSLRNRKLAEGSALFGIALEGVESNEETEQRKAFLADAVKDPELPEQDILVKLGMIDDEGKFQFPAKMFSKSTGQLWRKYIDFVRSQQKYFDMIKSDRNSSIPKDDLEAIELSRTSSHNELTRSVMRDLGVEDNEENFKFYRRLVAKMRDNAVPNTGEIKGTASKAYDWYEGISKNKAA